MGEKKSSFHIGNEFNGKGKKVCLRATQHNTYPPLSQENVRVTPDFGPSVGQVVVKKDDKTGKYKTELSVRKAYLTSGSYLYSNKKKSEKKEERVKFIMDTISGSVKR